MKKKLALFFLLLLLQACGEHSGYQILKYTGEYRYSNGIAEFFDCKQGIKYFVSRQAGISDDLQAMYQDLNLKDKKEDVFIKVDGYMKEEEQMEGIDPKMVFVAVELISHDVTRGCTKGYRRGQ